MGWPERRPLPGLSIVGLPDTAVQEEAPERVRVAISNSGYKFPTKKAVVNLAPANLRKEGAAFDFPIALGILAALKGVVSVEGQEGAGVVGELSLDGGLRGVRSALSMLEGARREGLLRLVCRRPTRRRRRPSAGWRSTGCGPCGRPWTSSAAVVGF
jgi:magnesium chelatase family protein